MTRVYHVVPRVSFSYDIIVEDEAGNLTQSYSWRQYPQAVAFVRALEAGKSEDEAIDAAQTAEKEEF